MVTGLEGLGATASALSIAKALVSIVSVIGEAFTFSDQCRRLAGNCHVIRLIIESHRDLLNDDNAIRGLVNSLTKCEKYLKECKERKFMRNPVFEVTFHRRISKYKSNYDDWIMTSLFSIETKTLSMSAETKRTDEQSVTRLENRWQTVLTSIRRLDSRLLQAIPWVSNTVPQIGPTSIQHDERPGGHTEFAAILQSGEHVRCIPLKTLYRNETPRLITNYSSLSGALHVQGFFGIFSDHMGKYAVMEDLLKQEGVLPLEEALRLEELGSASRQQKLRLSYEIATTVAYLHSVNILVKVISDSSVFIRFKNRDFSPVFSNLESARSFLYPTDDFSYDSRYEPPEYATAQVHSSSSDIWSLAILIWQILAGESLPQDATPIEIYKQFKGANDPLLHEILGDCLDMAPSSRPKSAILSQRLLDKYNDACAKSATEEVTNDRTMMTEIMTLIQRCQELVRQGRRNLPKNPKDILQPSEVDLLIQYEDSWDEPTALRLAPETCFLVGAGLLWDYIEVSDIERHRKGVEEMKSFEGML